MRRLLLIATLMCLASCSTIENLYTDVPKEVATMEAALATADQAAMIYLDFPVCGKTTAIACRTPSVTAKIGSAASAAYTAVQAARQAETQNAVDAAQTALVAYQAITNGLNIANK